MTCPKCGLTTLPEQKFCRSCGASLEMATQPLADPTATVSQTERTARTEPNERTNKSMLWGFILMFVGAAIGVVGKKLMHEDIVTVIGILMSLAGMFLTVYPYLLPARAKRNTNPNPQPNELPAFERKNLPKERDIDYVPSITERTTNLLETPRPRDVQKESGELKSQPHANLTVGEKE
jgi:zinc ribbon protein